MLQYNERGKAVFERACKGHKTRRKQAAVALARKVLVWCWAMLRDDKPWDAKRHERSRCELAEVTPFHRAHKPCPIQMMWGGL
jgi:hypothetical protein